MATVLVVLGVLVLLGLVLVAASVRILREYERGVVFRLGRLIEQKGAGVVFLVPFVDRLVRVSLRTVTLQIPAQEVITRDNVPARVTAVTYFRVIDPTSPSSRSRTSSPRRRRSHRQRCARSSARPTSTRCSAERERLNEDLQQIIDDQTEPWGIKVTTVEIKDVEIPADMQHAIARQAEAERERRAKIINAEGEFQAAAKLSDAADVISRNPVTIQLRYLQTLLEIGSEQNSTIVFPLPIDLVGPLLDAVKHNGAVTAAPPASKDSASPATSANRPPPKAKPLPEPEHAAR